MLVRRDGAGELYDVNQNSPSFADFQPTAAMPSLSWEQRKERDRKAGPGVAGSVS